MFIFFVIWLFKNTYTSRNSHVRRELGIFHLMINILSLNMLVIRTRHNFLFYFKKIQKIKLICDDYKEASVHFGNRDATLKLAEKLEG